MPASNAATAPVNCAEGTRTGFAGALGAFVGAGAFVRPALLLALTSRAAGGPDFFVLTDLDGDLAVGLFLMVPLEGFSFFGIARVGQLITSPLRASQAA